MTISSLTPRVLLIQAGRITASTILRKLGYDSRKNRLYQTFP